MHITSIIYYLSCSKYYAEIPSPAGGLSIFFNNIEGETSDDESDVDVKEIGSRTKNKNKNYPNSDDELIDEIEDELNDTTERLKRSLSLDFKTEKKVKNNHLYFDQAIDEKCVCLKDCLETICITSFKSSNECSFFFIGLIKKNQMIFYTIA